MQQLHYIVRQLKIVTNKVSGIRTDSVQINETTKFVPGSLSAQQVTSLRPCDGTNQKLFSGRSLVNFTVTSIASTSKVNNILLSSLSLFLGRIGTMDLDEDQHPQMYDCSVNICWLNKKYFISSYSSSLFISLFISLSPSARVRLCLVYKQAPCGSEKSEKCCRIIKRN